MSIAEVMSIPKGRPPIDLVLAGARELGAPIISGSQALFVWEGPEAPHLIGDFNGWDVRYSLEWDHEPPDKWCATLSLKPDSYMEYAFQWSKDEDDRISDPFNPRRVANGLGQYNNFFWMPEGRPTPLVDRQPDAPRGRVTRYTMRGWPARPGRGRTVLLYEPPAPGPWPLLVVYDGPDFYRRGRLTTIVDNLIGVGRIPPVAMAMLAHAGEARPAEYNCNDAMLEFVLEAVLPLATTELDLVRPEADPGAYGVLGASMGGLMAVYTGLNRPAIFGRVLSLSGAFIQNEAGLRPALFAAVHREASHRARIWMAAGLYEWLSPCNREMSELLEANGYETSFREYSGGHNYTAWRNEAWRGLEWCFGAMSQTTGSGTRSYRAGIGA